MNGRDFRFMKKLLPLFILAFAVLGCKNEPVSQPPIVTSQTPQTTPAQEKQFVNLFSLVEKSPQVVEKTLGKPKTAKKITDVSSTLFDEEREYQFPQSEKPYTVLVRFYKGRAVQFLTLAPEGNSDAAKFVERFGFDVKALKPQTYSMITNWQGQIDGIEFEKIAAMKSGNNYNHLTVIVRK